MIVYLVRHGQSEGNNQGRHQKSTTPLSPLGIKQAKCVAKRFKQIPVNQIISSPYKRALQTAEIISKLTGINIIVEPLLHEKKRPSIIEGELENDPWVVKIKKEIKLHALDQNWHYSNEENYRDFTNRAAKMVRKLSKLQYQNIIVVTHGSIMRAIMSEMLFQRPIESELFDRLDSHMLMTNTGITICEYQDKQWYLNTWNDDVHIR